MAAKVLKNLFLNKIAKYLKDRRYRQKVIKNKKAYDRKKKSMEIYSRSS